MFLSVVLPFSSRFWLLAFCFVSSAQKQPKQNAGSQNREENGSTTLRNTREKPLLAGYCNYSQIECLGFHVVNITRYVIRIKKNLHNRIEIIEIESNRKEYESLHPYF